MSAETQAKRGRASVGLSRQLPTRRLLAESVRNGAESSIANQIHGSIDSHRFTNLSIIEGFLGTCFDPHVLLYGVFNTSIITQLIGTAAHARELVWQGVFLRPSAVTQGDTSSRPIEATQRLPTGKGRPKYRVEGEGLREALRALRDG